MSSLCARSKSAILPPLPRKLRTPHATEQVLALVLVLAIKLDMSTTLLLFHLDFTFPAIPTPDNLLRLQDKLPNLVPLCLLLCMHVLPPQHASAAPTAYVADHVRARDELPRRRLVRVCVWEIAGGPARAVHASSDCEGRGSWRRNEVCAPVPARKALADYRGSGNQVGEAFVAAQVRGRGDGEVAGGLRG
jgi:hypothetical protein